MTAASQPAADVLAELTAMLADLVGVQARAVDAEQTFALLGLDSLLSVEFLGTLNARYGTAIPPGALYSYPTPRDLAEHVAALSGSGAGAETGAGAGAGTGHGGADGVGEQLRAQLAGILGCAPDDLDSEEAFTVLGLDSLRAAQFVEGVNRTWELSETPAVLYRFPDLASLAAHIATRAGAGGGVPVASPALVTSAAGRPTGTPAADIDLEALLDAVRDDLLSVDEAAALLDGRPV